MQFSRRFIGRIALAVLVPAALLLAAEAIARALGFAPASDLVVLESDPQHEGFVRLRALGISTDTPHVSPSFPVVKPAGAYRIALFGESAAAGFPHSQSSTPARWLACLLRDRFDGLNVEVVDCAIAGIGSDWMAQAAKRVMPLGVDLSIVYAGNNEFLSAFVERKRARGNRILEQLSNHSALYCWLRRLRSTRQAMVATRSPLDTTGYIDEPLGAVRRRIEDEFEANLEEVAATAHAQAGNVLFVRPVAARRDWPPQSSVVLAGISEADKRTLEEQLDVAAAALAKRDARAARAALEVATALDRDLALISFRNGELLELEGDEKSAVAAYALALDRDDRPSRVNAALSARIERAARTSASSYLDADDAFAQAGSGLAPADWIDDHVHLSIEGQYHLADLLVKELSAIGWPRPASEWKPSQVVDFATGVKAMDIHLGEAIVSQVQLGFSSILAAYEQPAGRLEHLARARREFARVLASDPQQPRALCGRGLVAAAEGRTDDAIADFDAAWKVAPRVPLEVKDSVARFAAFATILGTAGLTFAEDGRLTRK